jgi:hypothetical protein
MLFIGPGAAFVEFMIFAVSAALVVIVISRVLRGPAGPRRHPPGSRRHGGGTAGTAGGSWVCGKTDCRAENPEHARYCKRCGRQRVPTDFGE